MYPTQRFASNISSNTRRRDGEQIVGRVIVGRSSSEAQTKLVWGTYMKYLRQHLAHHGV